MLPHDRLSRFLQMERDAAQLRARFEALTSAHGYFQGNAALKSVSVSDAGDDGCVDAVFMDVRLRFQLLMIFSDDFEPRGRVVCLHCHSTYGEQARDSLGAFTFDAAGTTDLDTGIDGQRLSLQTGAPQIILTFIERALAANRRM